MDPHSPVFPCSPQSLAAVAEPGLRSGYAGHGLFPGGVGENEAEQMRATLG